MQKKINSMFAVVALALMLISSVQMAGAFEYAAASSVDINDLLANPTAAPVPEASEKNTGTISNTDTPRTDNDFINSVTNIMDATTPESEEVKEFGRIVQKGTSTVVQGLTYIFTGALIVSKLIDLFYVGIPITRTVLANGYVGNAAAAGTPQMQNGGMMGGMGGMNGGFGGGMGGFGGGMRGGMMGGGMYGRGGMMGGGMNSGMGMGGMGMGDAQMASQNQPMRGRIQFVSNAALNAVATESVVGPDGKGQSAFKTYCKDMIVSLLAAPILLVLCITGAIANIGFGIGAFVGDVLSGIRF